MSLPSRVVLCMFSRIATGTGPTTSQGLEGCRPEAQASENAVVDDDILSLIVRKGALRRSSLEKSHFCEPC